MRFVCSCLKSIVASAAVLASCPAWGDEDCDAIPPSGVAEIVRKPSLGIPNEFVEWALYRPPYLCRFSMLSDEAIERGLTSDVPQYAIGCHWQKRLRAAIAIAIEASGDEPVCDPLPPAVRQKIGAEFAAFAEDLARQLQTTLPPEVAEAFGRSSVEELRGCFSYEYEEYESLPRSDPRTWRCLMAGLQPDIDFHRDPDNRGKSRPFTIVRSDMPTFDVSSSVRFDPDPDQPTTDRDDGKTGESEKSEKPQKTKDRVTHLTRPDGVAFSVPRSTLPRYASFSETVAAVDAGPIYIVHSPGTFGFGPDPIVAVSKQSNALRWVSSVWMETDGGGINGIHSYPIVSYSRSRDDGIVVYTSAAVAFSIEKFSLADGSPIVRFNPDNDLPLRFEPNLLKPVSPDASPASSDEP